MRITGGTLGGRKLNTPEGKTTRPTSDRVREALFDIIAHHDWGEKIGNPLENRRVLDAFAGTGALGLESLSRGANECIFFEKDRNALKSLRDNIALLNQRPKSKILPIDATHPPKTDTPCSLVFLDPPYYKNLIPKTLEVLNKMRWITPEALIIAETARGESLEMPPTLQQLLARDYGDTSLLFFGKRG
ncbi:MAG: 16S rRNA (guanine(966)-N(2))-methyltransferase RsmD [Bdellovibrionales bacterium]